MRARTENYVAYEGLLALREVVGRRNGTRFVLTPKFAATIAARSHFSKAKIGLPLRGAADLIKRQDVFSTSWLGSSKGATSLPLRKFISGKDFTFENDAEPADGGIDCHSRPIEPQFRIRLYLVAADAPEIIDLGQRVHRMNECCPRQISGIAKAGLLRKLRRCDVC